MCSPPVPSELIVAFLWQELIHECATVLYYTYVTHASGIKRIIHFFINALKINGLLTKGEVVG